MEQFEYAARNKLRFESTVGPLTAEDLWDLPLTAKAGRASLNEVAVALHLKLKNSDEAISFVDEAAGNTAAKLLQRKFDLVKYVIDTKKAEAATRAEAAAKAERAQKIMAILAKRGETALEGKSDEELLAMLAA